MHQLSHVLIKVEQCDWEAILAAGSIFPQEICRALGLASELSADTQLTENICGYNNF